MRKQSFIILALSLFFGIVFAVPGQAQTVSVNLKLLDSNITVGESFAVEVWANESSAVGEELLAFGFDVATLGEVFSYDGYTIESGLMDISDLLNPNNVSGSAFPGVNDADVLLAILSFTAGLVEGVGTLSIEGLYDALDPFYGLYYESDNNVFDIESSLDITVRETNPVPEPSTVILLGAGCLASLAFFRKDKKS